MLGLVSILSITQNQPRKIPRSSDAGSRASAQHRHQYFTLILSEYPKNTRIATTHSTVALRVT